MAVPTLTEQLDNLYTTTWELRKGTAHDNIFTSTAFWFWMKNGGKLRTEEGGRFIMEPLEYAKNDTITWLTKGGTVPLNDFEFLTESKWDWKYVAITVVRFGIDDQQNRGKAAIMKLMNRKLDNAENSLVDEIETNLFTAQAGNKPYGLPDLVADTSTNTVAGIARGTYTWFKNKTKTATSRSFAVYGLTDMRDLLFECMGNRLQDAPDIIVTHTTPYGYYDDETMEQKQIVNKTLGDAGFQNLEFKGIPMIWSPACPSDNMYFLNTRFLYFVYDPMMNFDMTEWKPIPEQVNDRAAQVALACAFICTRPMTQGVYHTIDTA